MKDATRLIAQTIVMLVVACATYALLVLVFGAPDEIADALLRELED